MWVLSASAATALSSELALTSDCVGSDTGTFNAFRREEIVRGRSINGGDTGRSRGKDRCYACVSERPGGAFRHRNERDAKRSGAEPDTPDAYHSPAVSLIRTPSHWAIIALRRGIEQLITLPESDWRGNAAADQQKWSLPTQRSRWKLPVGTNCLTLRSYESISLLQASPCATYQGNRPTPRQSKS